jgi:hypothetical protein
LKGNQLPTVTAVLPNSLIFNIFAPHCGFGTPTDCAQQQDELN